jgi:hypothetical protein
VSTNAFVKTVLLLSIGLLPVYAERIVASGAGPLLTSAEDLTANLPTEIVGTISDTFDGASVFKLIIQDYAEFSAVVLPEAFGIPDTELFLFDANGFGVYANDDIDGGNTLSCLPSDVGNPCPSSRPPGVGPASNGVYYLAVTRSENSPLSIDGNIFTILNFTDVVGPDPTAGGNSPFTGWDGGAFTSPDTDLVNYDIIITGAVPEPSTGALVATAAFLLVLLRRKSIRL